MGFHKPAQMVASETFRGPPPACRNRGTAGKSFEAIAMIGAGAGEGLVAHRAGYTHMAGFRMSDTTQRPAILDQADADARAHGHIAETI